MSIDQDYVFTAVLLAGFAAFCWLWINEHKAVKRYRLNRFQGTPRRKQRVVCYYCGQPVRRIDARKEQATGRYCCGVCEVLAE